jgi:4-amino-4-deoxy-L-arabinose transferase-like glycosyltransferase
MTGFFDGLLALLLACTLNSVIAAQIKRRLPGEEGRFLARIYLWTVALRFALALFLNIYSGQSSFADAFWGDSFQYDQGGFLLSEFWKGEVLINPYVQSRVSGWGFYYVVAWIYYVFGRNQLLVQFLNGTIGALTVLVIYAIAKDLFDTQVAQWSARFMAFFPQMLFWSGALYKDPAIMLCISLCMYAVLKLRTRLTTTHVVLFIVPALALMTLRFYVFYFVVFATLGTFVLSQRRGFVGSVFTQGVLLGVFLLAFSFAASRESIERQTDYFDLEKVQVARADQAKWGQSAFEKEADVSTTAGALSALPKGLLFLLFAPFPWSISGVRQLLTLPETLVWYALWPSLIRGLYMTVRTRLRAALPILVFAASLTCAYAIFQGNVGTAYRQRTQVTMFFFIFMAAGYVQSKQAKQKKPAVAAPAYATFGSR